MGKKNTKVQKKLPNIAKHLPCSVLCVLNYFGNIHALFCALGLGIEDAVSAKLVLERWEATE